MSEEEFQSARTLLDAHVAMAHRFYEKLLGTSFEFSKTYSTPFQSASTHLEFAGAPNGGDDDRAHRIVKELFQWNQEDRYSSHRIYVVIYVRPLNERLKSWEENLGGARPFNGAPNTGGGYVEMEYASLIRDIAYPFQSTLVHELGHAFGLTHPDCKGYDLYDNMSIMSYNPRHHSKGLTESDDPGGFLPGDYFALSLNKRAFPDFVYDGHRHNPQGKPLNLARIQQCFLPPMGPSIGALKQFDGVGYELFFNGQKVNGPDAVLYSHLQAMQNLEWNRKNHPGVKVEGRYNGKKME